MEQKKNYWLTERTIKDGHLERTLYVTDQWQIRPDGAIELTEEEYIMWQKIINKN